MKKQQLLVSAIGLVLVVLIYQLPRVVVENDADAEVATHSFDVTPEDRRAISALTSAFTSSNDEKNSIFADSLAGYFLRYGKFDSAEWVVSELLERDSSLNTVLVAIKTLYKLFERSVDTEEAETKAMAIKPLLERAVSERPDDLSLKTKLAMTVMTTEAPMVGVQMLREVIAVDPNNREALINLGLLSIKSGQYDRAVERFEQLLALDTADYEALLYLGVSWDQKGEKGRAIEAYTQVFNAANVDPALKKAAEDYLAR
ncbi:MAG: tetratricopeptide repeat protein [Bacteroidota bacterium]